MKTVTMNARWARAAATCLGLALLLPGAQAQQADLIASVNLGRALKDKALVPK